MRLRFPLPVAVLAGMVGLGAIAVAGAQAPPTLQPAANPEVSYTVAMLAANETGGGETGGAGQATVTINGTTGLVCVNVTTTGIGSMTGMHIHTGA
ncbi:MAG: hypothetical protein E6G39_12895, partial [Actinobacteria bacterium]